MANRLRFSIGVFLVSGLATFTACSSDGDDSTGMPNGGAGAGGTAGSGGAVTAGTGGKASSGGGGAAAGGAASGGSTSGGSGGASNIAGTSSVNPGLGGAMDAAGAAGADTAAGAAGAAGAPPALVYPCGDTNIDHKLCSALVSANCTDPTVCADCVTSRTSDEETFSTCPACTAEFDAYYQCAIDAFEGGHLSDGVECFDGFGADISDACGDVLNSAVQCTDVAASQACPTTWP